MNRDSRGRYVPGLVWLVVACCVAQTAIAGDVTVDGDLTVNSNLAVQGEMSVGGTGISAGSIARWDGAVTNAQAAMKLGGGYLVYATDFSTDPFQENWAKNDYVWWTTNAIKIKVSYYSGQTGIATYTNATTQPLAGYALSVTLSNTVSYGINMIVYNGTKEVGRRTSLRVQGVYTLSWTSAWNKIVFESEGYCCSPEYLYLSSVSVYCPTGAVLTDLSVGRLVGGSVSLDSLSTPAIDGVTNIMAPGGARLRIVSSVSSLSQPAGDIVIETAGGMYSTVPGNIILKPGDNVYGGGATGGRSIKLYCGSADARNKDGRIVFYGVQGASNWMEAASMNSAGNWSMSGTVSATSFSGSGSGLTGISGAGIAAGSISSSQLADGSVVAGKIAAGAVEASHLGTSVDDRYVNSSGDHVAGDLTIDGTMTVASNAITSSRIDAWNKVETATRIESGMVYSNDFSSDPFQSSWTKNTGVWWLSGEIKMGVNYYIPTWIGTATYSNSVMYHYASYTLAITVTNSPAYGIDVIVYQQGTQKAKLSNVHVAGTSVLSWTSAWDRIVLQAVQTGGGLDYLYVDDIHVDVGTNTILANLDAGIVHASSLVVGELTSMDPASLVVGSLNTTNVIPKNEGERLVIRTGDRTDTPAPARDGADLLLRTARGNNTIYERGGNGGNLVVECGAGGHSSYTTDGNGGSFIVVPGTNGTDGGGTVGYSYFARKVYIGDASTSPVSYLEYSAPTTIAVRASVVPADGATYRLGTADKPWKDAYLAGVTVSGAATLSHVVPQGDLSMGSFTNGP